MSFQTVAARGLNRDVLLRFLASADLPQVRAVNVNLEATLADGKVWLACARTALPGFDFRCENFQEPQRRKFLTFVFAMAKAMLAEGPARPGTAVTERLCGAVIKARQASAAHRPEGGGGAGYFVAHLRFVGEHMAAALEKGPEPPASRMFFSEPIRLPDVPGAGGLQLHFALRGGTFYLACRDDGLPSEVVKSPVDLREYQWPRSVDFTLGLSSVDSNVLMHYRGLSMSKNGPWEPVLSGMKSYMKGKPAAAEALTQGVMCVFSVHTGAPKASTHVAHYLNLDKRSL